MKILCVIDNLGSGGAQRQMVTLALGLKEQGYQVEFFTYFPQNFFENVLLEHGIKVMSTGKKDKLGMNIMFRLKQLLKDNNYDIAISYLKAPNIYLSLAARLAGTKTKIFSSERTRTNLEQSPLVTRMRYWCHRRSDAVVFNSFHEKENWISKFAALKQNSVTIYNGVDTDRFKPLDRKYTRIKRILGVGTQGPEKNIHTLIEAVKILKEKGERISVSWYGKHVSTHPAYKAYHEKLVGMIRDLELSDVWEWHPPSKNIEAVMPQYDCLVLPSVLEGLPNVACEAMACGVPVILANLLDHPILVKENSRGFLFAPEDAGELATQISKIYQLDDSTYEQMRNNGREYALTELSINRFVNNYVDLFNQTHQLQQ